MAKQLRRESKPVLNLRPRVSKRGRWTRISCVKWTPTGGRPTTSLGPALPAGQPLLRGPWA